MKEKKRRVQKSLFNINNITQDLNVRISIPSAYRTAKYDSCFFWLKREIRTGSLNLLIYELPWEDFTEIENKGINRIIDIRDSIGEKHIHGVVDGTYLATEKTYTPYSTMTTISKTPAIMTQGIWKLKNAYMGGPFINYVILDKFNNRVLIAEGFVFAPTVAKRNYIFELETVINSLEIVN